MDNQISQLLLANRQVAYLTTNTNLEVINVSGDYGLLHNLIHASNMTHVNGKKRTHHTSMAYLGQLIVELVPELDSCRSALQEVLCGAVIDAQSIRLNRSRPCKEIVKAATFPNGTNSTANSFFDIVFSPKHNLAGDIEGILFLIEDTTETCLMQASTQQLKNGKQMLQDQLDMIAHELGSPLTIIAGYLELLREVAETRSDTEYLQYLNLVSSKVDHLHVIFKNLFNMAYVESESMRMVMQPVNIVNMLYQLVSEMHPQVSARGQQIQIKTDGEEQIVTCDRLHITQALTHLLDNASKFSPSGGAIEVTVSSGSRPGYIHIAIMDSGSGIPIHERDSIFQRFYRTKFADNGTHNGVGLGLYTARRIVEIHNGEIWCDNAHQAGSVFHVMLPIGKSSPRPSKQLNQLYSGNMMQAVI